MKSHSNSGVTPTTNPRAMTLKLKLSQITKEPAVPKPPQQLPSWRPARDVGGLQAQLIDLLVGVPEMLLGPVTPLAIGTRAELLGMARPGHRKRTLRWIAAWCSTPAWRRRRTRWEFGRPATRRRRTLPARACRIAHRSPDMPLIEWYRRSDLRSGP